MRHLDVHPSDRDLLSLSDRELSRSRQQAVEAHTAGCPRCRARLTDLLGVLSAAREASARDSEVDVQARMRLQRALRAAAVEPPVRRWALADLYRSPGLAAAAVLLLTMSIWGSGMWKLQVGQGVTPNTGASTVLPVAQLTPGAVSIVSAAELCAGRGISRVVPAEIRTQVLRAYDMERVPDADYELDALITPELGGTTDARNLWPQRYASPIWNARVKDELEQHLAGEVCNGRLDLAMAQRDIAADWVAAYRKYFHTEEPLQAHVGPPVDDHELVIAAATPTLFGAMRD